MVRLAPAAMAAGSDIKRTRMKSASYGTEVIRSLNRLKMGDELCDFTVLAEGKSIKVHKILLVATSDYFRAMLLGPMKESKEEEVDLQGLTSQALDQIIDFIYSGEIDLDLDNLIEIINAANHLQIQTALDLCSDYMISLLTFGNADQLLEIADKYSLTKVTDFYNRKVLQNFEEFATKTDQFLQLSAAQLASYLSADTLRIRSEAQLYDAVARWFAHDQQKRLSSVDQVVKQMRFGLMSPAHLEHLRQHWLTRHVQTNLVYINKGIEYHGAAVQGYPLNKMSDAAQARVRQNHQSLVFVHQGNTMTNRPFEVAGFDEQEQKFYHLANDISGSRDCRVVTLDNFLYICRVVDCGGGTLMNSLRRFDPRHLTLQELTPCRHLRIDPALVGRGQWLYVFGGTSDTFQVMDSVECYDSHSNTWINVLPMPAPTHSHAGVAVGEKLYLAGGVSGTERQAVTTLLCYHTATQTWETKASMHCARRLHEMALIGESKIFVLGGMPGPGTQQQTLIPIECYNVATNQWTLLTSTFAGRSVGHFVAYKGKILSIGREHLDATEDEIWQYDIDTDTWKTYTKMPKSTGLSTASASLLCVNFFDEKIYKHVITDRR